MRTRSRNPAPPTDEVGQSYRDPVNNSGGLSAMSLLLNRKFPCMKWREKQDGFAGQRLVVVPRPVLVTALQQPLLRHLLPTDAGYYPKAKGHTCVRKHGCPEVIFIYCADGSGWCEIAGRRHEIARNQMLVINAATPHVYGAGKETPWTI